jgi:hypothetical protein
VKINFHNYTENELEVGFKKHNDEIDINFMVLRVWYMLIIGFQSVHKMESNIFNQRPEY